MAQIGMGGFQAVGDFQLIATIGTDSEFLEIPDNHFVIGQLSFSDINDLGGGGGSVSLSKKDALEDMFSFGVFSLGQVFFGNDGSGDPRVALNPNASGIYLSKGFYSLSISGMSAGSGALFSGVLFKNAPLVNP